VEARVLIELRGGYFVEPRRWDQPMLDTGGCGDPGW
jgi:hypothetical protein